MQVILSEYVVLVSIISIGWLFVTLAVNDVDYCFNLVPDEFNNTEPSTLTSPVYINVTKSRYFAGVAEKVVIDYVSGTQKVNVTGFTVAAYSDLFNNYQQGRFYFYSFASLSGTYGVECPNRNLGHDDGAGFTMVISDSFKQSLSLPLTLYWMSHYYVGNIQFKAAVYVSNATHGDTYWPNVSSQVLTHSSDLYPCLWLKSDCGDNICITRSEQCPDKCPNGEFFCNPLGFGARCVSQDKVCDRQLDCPDPNYNDENQTICGYDCPFLFQYKCARSSTCIENRDFCDSNNDCGTWDDEFNCFGECGGELTMPSATITPPLQSLSSDKYKAPARCWWQILAPPGDTVRLLMRDIDLEYCPLCSCDSITVYDGGRSDRVMLKICKMVKFRQIDSTGNKMTMDFVSDASNNRKAWSIDYLIIPTNGNCSHGNLCKHGRCVVIDSTSVCQCDPGFINPVGMLDDCIDIDECLTSDCGVGGTCINMEGGYTCQCNTSYRLSTNGIKCLPECNRYEKECPDQSCVSIYGLCPGEVCPGANIRCDLNQTCLPLSKRCDGIRQCSDATDEKQCKTQSQCSERERVCNDGTACVKYSQFCNNRNDCKDGTDEASIYCQQYSGCSSDQFQCPRSNLCIPNSLLCDEIRDCPIDAYDEERIKCYGINEFRCTSGTKLSAYAVQCNGERDCSDGEDELNCPDVQSIKFGTPPVIISVVVVVVVVVVICVISVYITVRKRQIQLSRRRSVAMESRNMSRNAGPDVNRSLQQPSYSAGNHQPGSYTHRPSPRITTNRLLFPGEVVPESLPPSYNEVISPNALHLQLPKEDPPPPSYDSLPDELKAPSVEVVSRDDDPSGQLPSYNELNAPQITVYTPELTNERIPGASFENQGEISYV